MKKRKKLEITLTNDGKQLGHIIVHNDSLPIDVILDEVKRVLVEDNIQEHLRMYTEEVWKTINYQGVDFTISTMGRIKNKHGVIHYGCQRSDGYRRVGRKYNGKKVSAYVHKLVAIAFLKFIEGKDIVNHKNHNRGDNRVVNLEWVTPSENMKKWHEHKSREETGGLYTEGYALIDTPYQKLPQKKQLTLW